MTYLLVNKRADILVFHHYTIPHSLFTRPVQTSFCTLISLQCFKNISFIKISLKYLLILQKLQNFRAPPQAPETALPHCRFLATRLPILYHSIPYKTGLLGELGEGSSEMDTYSAFF